MLVNLSNHPVSKWTPEQMQAALVEFGGVVDLPFPNIPPDVSREWVLDCAYDYTARARALLPDPHREHDIECPQWRSPAESDECTCPRDAIHLMGETSFVVSFARIWGEGDARPDQVGLVCSTTERVVEQLPNGEKRSVFLFVKFREM